MNKSIKRLVATLSFAFASLISFSGCSILKGLEKSCDVEFVGGTPFTTTHVSTFGNGLTPHVNSGDIPVNHKFFGWTVYDNVHYSDPDFEHKYVLPDGIVRYDDIKNFVVDGKVTMKPLYINRDELPVYYLVVGWYAKSGTSGLDSDHVDAWVNDLKTHLVNSCGATEAQLKLVSVRPYDGNVGTAGGLINADGDVDITLGFGANIKTQGGVDYIERFETSFGGKTGRYVYKHETRPVVDSVYEWLKTDAARAALG